MLACKSNSDTRKKTAGMWLGDVQQTQPLQGGVRAAPHAPQTPQTVAAQELQQSATRIANTAPEVAQPAAAGGRGAGADNSRAGGDTKDSKGGRNGTAPRSHAAAPSGTPSHVQLAADLAAGYAAEEAAEKAQAAAAAAAPPTTPRMMTTADLKNRLRARGVSEAEVECASASSGCVIVYTRFSAYVLASATATLASARTPRRAPQSRESMQRMRPLCPPPSSDPWPWRLHHRSARVQSAVTWRSSFVRRIVLADCHVIRCHKGACVVCLCAFSHPCRKFGEAVQTCQKPQCPKIVETCRIQSSYLPPVW